MLVDTVKVNDIRANLDALWAELSNPHNAPIPPSQHVDARHLRKALNDERGQAVRDPMDAMLVESRGARTQCHTIEQLEDPGRVAKEDFWTSFIIEVQFAAIFEKGSGAAEGQLSRATLVKILEDDLFLATLMTRHNVQPLDVFDQLEPDELGLLYCSTFMRALAKNNKVAPVFAQVDLDCDGYITDAELATAMLDSPDILHNLATATGLREGYILCLLEEQSNAPYTLQALMLRLNCVDSTLQDHDELRESAELLGAGLELRESILDSNSMEGFSAMLDKYFTLVGDASRSRMSTPRASIPRPRGRSQLEEYGAPARGGSLETIAGSISRSASMRPMDSPGYQSETSMNVSGPNSACSTPTMGDSALTVLGSATVANWPHKP